MSKTFYVVQTITCKIMQVYYWKLIISVTIRWKQKKICNLFNFPQSSLRADNEILDRTKLLFVLNVSLKVK